MQVRGSAFNENVFGIFRYFRVFAIDYGWKRQNHAVLVFDDGVNGAVLDDWQVLLQMRIFLQIYIKNYNN